MLKTVKISEAAKRDLDKICKEHDLNIGEAVEAMISFFRKTKENPAKPSDFVDEFKRLKNQLIGFIKTQEQNKLNPIVDRLNACLNELEALEKLLGFMPDYFAKEGKYWERFSENLDNKGFVKTEHFERLINTLKNKFERDDIEKSNFKNKVLQAWKNFKDEYKAGLTGSNFKDISDKYTKIFEVLCT